MKYLFDSLDPIAVSGAKLFIAGKTNGESLTVTVRAADDASPSVNGTVSYNGETFSFYTYGSTPQTLAFTYSDSVKTLILSCGSVTKTLTWHASYADPSPVADIGYTGVRINSDLEITFDCSGSQGYGALVAPRLFYKDRANGWTLIDYTASKNTSGSCAQHIFAGNPPGTQYKCVLLFALYGHSGDPLGNYIGLTEYELPVFTLTAAGTPFAPCGLKYESAHSGCPLPVSWNSVNDPDFTIDEYVVKRSVDSGVETEVYRGTSPYFTDTTPAAAHTVAYSVCSVSGDILSHYTEGETITLASSNVFVGTSGAVRPAARVFTSIDGAVTEASAVWTVG